MGEGVGIREFFGGFISLAGIFIKIFIVDNLLKLYQ